MKSASKVRRKSRPAKSPGRQPDASGDRLLRQAWRFLARLACWYGVLLALWIPCGYGYRNMLVGAGNALASMAAPAGSVSFRVFAKGELGKDHSRADVAVLVHDADWRDGKGRNQHLVAKHVATFYQPYSATAFLLALFAAGKVGTRRRLLGLAGGLVVLHALMIACVAIDVVFTFASNGAMPGLPEWLGETVTLLHVSVTDWPAGVLLVPLLLWLLALWPAPGPGSPASRKVSRIT